MIQLEVYDIEHTAHARQLLVMLLRLIINRRHRYVITHRRIRAHPPTILRIEIPRSVVIEPRLLILFLRSKLVRQVSHTLFICRLLLYPELPVRRIFYALVFIAFVVCYKLCGT